MAKTNAKNEKKGNNKKLVLVIAIAMLLVATVGATFAYFASRTEVSNTLNIVTNIENNNGSFITTATNIELNITASSMQESVANNVAASNTGVLNVEYLSGSENGITCKYDINYEWVSDNNENPYTITNILKDEFTYEVTDGSNTIISERNFVASSNRNKQKLGTGYIANASTSEPTRKTYQINAKFYNLEENQSNNANKNWEIKFYVDNVICGVDVENEYTLSGILLDENNNPVSNATILTHSEAKYTTTDSTGAFTITGLEQGNHNIYYVPNKTILEVSQMSDNEISQIAKSGIFTTNTTNTITLTDNYKIESINIKTNKILKREYPITVNYKNTNNETIKESETNTTCIETESYTVTPVNINGYVTPSSYTGTCGTSNTVNFTYELDGEPLNTKIKSLAGTSSSNSDGAWQVLNETVGSYTNTIYTGANPNNYVRYNGEIWRIIGVYNEDTHGKTGEQLVKIIRNDSLGSFSWDYKETGVGSSTSTYEYGSNEWSDSQLMFMLNGNSAINKGKLYNGSSMSEYTTSVSGDYIVDKNNYKIFKNAGSYLDSTKTVYVPAEATTSSLTETTGTLPSTLSSESQNMIEEVTWHLGGPDTKDDTTKNTASGYYTYERGNQVCGTITDSYGGCTASTTSTVRSTTWTGKIGLMYPSDYGYATNGGSTITRSACLGHQMNGWRDGSYRTDCTYNSWLLYTNATSTSKGTVTIQLTITPSSSSADSVACSGVMEFSFAYGSYAARPVLYLKTGVKTTTGDGTYDNPYELSM